MQIAIDNAKRRSDIDLTGEIQAIKKNMNIKEHGYPAFWAVIRKGFNQKNINRELKCPMNYVYNLVMPKYHSPNATLPMTYFFVKQAPDKTRKTCRKVEELINKYSLGLYSYNTSEERDERFVLLRSDFENLVADIRKIYISGNYLGLFSWLIDRAFMINPGTKRNIGTMKSTINKNKSLLMKTLYEVNPNNLLRCFSKNLYK